MEDFKEITNPRKLVDIGKQLVEEQSFSNAFKCLKKATKLDPNIAEAWYYLGIAQMEKKFDSRSFFKSLMSCFCACAGFTLNDSGSSREIKAKEYYQNAINLNPNYVNALINLGIIEHELGYTEVGLKHLRKALDVEPENSIAIDGIKRIVKKHLEKMQQKIKFGDLDIELGRAMEGWVKYAKEAGPEIFEVLKATNPLGQRSLLDSFPRLIISSSIAKSLGKINYEDAIPYIIGLIGSLKAKYSEIFVIALSEYTSLEAAKELVKLSKEGKSQEIKESASSGLKEMAIRLGHRDKDEMLASFNERTLSLIINELREGVPVNISRISELAKLSKTETIFGIKYLVKKDPTKGEYLPLEEVFIRKKSDKTNNIPILEVTSEQFEAITNHAKKLEEEMHSYQKILGSNPQDFDAMFKLGSIYLDVGKNDEAIQVLSKLLKAQQNNYEAWYNLGLAYFRKKSYPNAEKCFENAIKLNPNYIEALYELGMVFFVLKNHQEAMKRFSKIIEINPNHIDALINIAKLYSNLNDEITAIQYYGRVLKIDENNFDGLLGMGALVKDKQRSIEFLEKAVKSNPDVNHVWLLLGADYIEVENFQRGIECYRRSLEIVPDNDEILNTLGMLYNITGKTQEAINYYKKAIEINPYNKDAKENLEDAYRSLVQSKK
ncbi:MAG: tetratricopeptide repeat protein [Promethearchaeota archaeon]